VTVSPRHNGTTLINKVTASCDWLALLVLDHLCM